VRRTTGCELLRWPGAFVPVARATAILAKLRPQRRNGSAIDTALRRADQLLQERPPGHPRRVVVFTDLRMRSALDVASLQSALRRSGALLHIVQVDEGDSPALRRANDEERWTSVPQATGGLLWSATISADPERRTALEQACEELARPMRLHDFGLDLPGLELHPDQGEEVLDQAELAEGEAVLGLEIGETEAPWLEIRGRLWARAIRVRALPDPAEARRWSALVFGTTLLSELSDAEMMVLARRGGAVSPVTSYLAIESGVRPSTDGFEEEGSGTGLGLSGIGEGGGCRGEGTGIGSAFDHRAWLRTELGKRWQACSSGNRHATVTLETTLDEIVDVMQVTADSDASRACLTEATWRLELSNRFTDERTTWTIEL
jgi:hypothetical protein